MSACVKVPEFKGGDGGTADTATTSDAPTCGAPDYSDNGPGDVAFSDDQGGGLVTSDTMWSMHFAAGAQFHFPDNVFVGLTDVMTGESSPPCGQEDLAGMALYPAAAIRPNGSAQVGANDLNVEAGWGGPAIIKLNVHWSTSYSCGVTPGGDSYFTLFPEGRIVRHDYMFSGGVDWATCDCNGASDFYPTSYWTFLQSAFMTVTAGGQTMNVNGFPGAYNQQQACLQGSSTNLSVATAWRLTAQQTGSRVINIPNRVAYVFDWTMDHQTTNVGPIEYSQTSMLMLGHGCTTGLARASEFTANGPEILINNNPRRPGLADGIYGGADNRSMTGGFPLTGMAARIDGPAPVGFAVWLKFPQPACALTVQKLPDSSPGFYTKQRIDDDEWVIWFRDALESTHHILVTGT